MDLHLVGISTTAGFLWNMPPISMIPTILWYELYIVFMLDSNINTEIKYKVPYKYKQNDWVLSVVWRGITQVEMMRNAWTHSKNTHLHIQAATNGRHFKDDTFKCIFCSENSCIFIQISLKFVPKCPKIKLFHQWSSWLRRGDKPLYENKWRLTKVPHAHASLGFDELVWNLKLNGFVVF